MQYRSLLSSLRWINRLRQSNHLGAVFALSLSLTLAACGGGGSTVTENDLAEPGPDGVAPTLTMVEAYNEYNKSSVVEEGDTLTISFTSDEALMTPIVTIGGVTVEANGTVTSWTASRGMVETDVSGPIAITIEFSDTSGETGTPVSAVTEGDAPYFCGAGCAVGPGGVIQTVIDFETANGSYSFVDFGPDSQTSAVVQDPTDASNTVAYSEKKAAAEVWGGTTLTVAGTTFQLTSADGVMSMRLWSPESGKTVRLKLEASDGGFVEADATTTVSELWETLTFDFTAPAGGAINPDIEYVGASLFYDFGTAGTGSDVGFYWDDVTYGGLVNDNAPTIAGRWKLVSEVGSAGVGPAAGNVDWWKLGAGDLTARACFLDDVYVLGEDGSFTLELGTETWLEEWQSGSAEACGTPIAPHDGTSTSYTYTFADNALTVNGEGAYIGIAKAGNTYAYETNGVPTSIEYSVVSLNTDYTAMTIAVQVTKDDGAIDFWTYKLEKEVPAAIAGRWKIANEVGSAGVGPAAGNVDWWKLGAGDLTARACFLDDVYVFGDDGSFSLELGAETWLEEWQSGSAEACGTPIAPHDGTSTSYTFTYADNTITVNGSGAYIGIAKAGNTYAYETNGVPTSIEYSVVSLNADNTAMTIAVQVTKDDGAIDFWTYKLEKEVPAAIAGRWKIASEVGSAGVGPAAGNVDWWKLGAGDLTARACFLDDVYVFGEDGSFALELGAETWLEEWQSGSAEACGTPIAPHDGTSTSYTFTYADNTITVNGEGAYIGIAKAGNTYAYETNGVPTSIEYSVVSLSADNSEMTIAVQVTKDDGAIDFWTYKLVKEVAAVPAAIAGRWQIANEVGSAGVGPAAGNVDWWKLGAGDLTARACFLDDVYVFGDDGSFALELGTETWLEEWQSGSAEACGTPIAPHDGTSTSYTYTFADNTITVNGSGAYIGIAKAGNTYAYETNGVPTSIEYSVISLSSDNSSMTIAVQTTKDDGAIDFWTYKLVKSS